MEPRGLPRSVQRCSPSYRQRRPTAPGRVLDGAGVEEPAGGGEGGDLDGAPGAAAVGPGGVDARVVDAEVEVAVVGLGGGGDAGVGDDGELHPAPALGIVLERTSPTTSAAAGVGTDPGGDGEVARRRSAGRRDPAPRSPTARPSKRAAVPGRPPGPAAPSSTAGRRRGGGGANGRPGRARGANGQPGARWATSGVVIAWWAAPLPGMGASPAPAAAGALRGRPARLKIQAKRRSWTRISSSPSPSRSAHQVRKPKP